jgi:hypothetical protein
MTSDLIDPHVPVEPAYAFLGEHSRAERDGKLGDTCKADGEPWPCLPARAFFAGRRSGLDVAAGRLETLAEGFTGTLGVQRVQQVAAHLRVDADEIDQGLRAARPAVNQKNRDADADEGSYPPPEAVVIRWVHANKAEILAGNPDGVPGQDLIAEITASELGTSGLLTVVHIINMLGLAYTFTVDVEGVPPDFARRNEVDPMPVFVIKGKDSLAPAAVMAYADLCVGAGLEDQASEVESAFLEITEWQRLHPEAVKTPDHKHVPARPVRDGAAAAIERDAAEHAAELGESAEEYAAE